MGQAFLLDQQDFVVPNVAILPEEVLIEIARLRSGQ